MDKNAIKKYAVWARNELISRVAQKADQYGITEAEIISASEDSIYGRLLTPVEKKQRTALIARIKVKGYKQVIEEVAYTWFNRLTAIRFMEVNGYLPTHIRVFTDEENRFAPQILAEAIHLDMPGLNMDKVFELKQANKTEELYKYLLITQCNALNEILPGMFQRIEDYTELLLPDNLLREGSVIEQMISLIPEEDWTDQVQIIGWLYQFYNTEPKEQIFENLKKNIKISKENIPAATQLFTPDWIVRYMVENSLGRLWLEGHTNNELKTNWKYYIDESSQEEAVKAQLETIRCDYANIKPEEIKVIDPCMGSGHILCYMFDVLVQIYESYGYTSRDAVSSIVENNIFGLDIDDRASQLAYFAVMMKARQYDRRFFSRAIKPNVYAIKSSNNISSDIRDYFINGDDRLKTELNTLLSEMHDADEYGSILHVSAIDFELLFQRFAEIEEDVSLFRQLALDELLPIVTVAQALSNRYDVVVTNPPYMGRKSLNSKLSQCIEDNFENGKSELYSAFIERCNRFTKHNGFTAMVTMHTWMFISTFKKLRETILRNETITSMMHTGAAAFEDLNSFNVLTTAFVRRNTYINDYIGAYVRLSEYYNVEDKLNNFDNAKNRFFINQKMFFFIDEQPIIYWLSRQTYDIFHTSQKVEDYGQLTNGLFTCDNARFVRNWHEVYANNIGFGYRSADEASSSCKKWFPYVKGGNYRKWYGNNEYVVNYQFNGAEIRDYRVKQGQSKRFPGESYYFHPGITWAPFGFENFGVRYKYYGDVFDIAGSSLFVTDKKQELYILAFLASKVGFYLLSTIAPTVNFQIGNVGSLPLIVNEEYKPLIDQLAQKNIEISVEEWNDYETSWDFVNHPLVRNKTSLKSAFEEWEIIANTRYEQIRENEERINDMFIDTYHLERCVDRFVVDRDISVKKADLSKDVRSLISYAVGCMFGRYSLNYDGLVYAGGEWDDSKYITFKADRDNVLPICDDEYFEDDIVGKFVKFVEVVYGKDTLEENLKFIADALGGSGSPRDVIRSYFLNDFYADHLKVYQKRPIYWQFDSGKKNGFKCLIYMHRYQPDTIARIRTDYVHEQQARYRTAIADLEQRIQVATTSERVKLSKQLQKLKDQETEIRLFEEKVHHLADQMIRIDLDDGVKHNYEIFKDVLTKIK